MRRNVLGTNLKIAGLASVLLLVLAASPAQAAWNNTQPFTLAERQLLLLERMTNSALFAALRLKESPGLSSIHWSRGRFDRMLGHLREGNPYTGLEPTTEPEILDKLNRASMQWRQYNAIFGEIVTAGKASQVQIHELTTSHATTVEALKGVVDSYGFFVYGGRYHSILSSTINGTGRLRASTQAVLRNLLMVVYHEYDAPDRERLAQATEDFNQTIDGLLNGSQERRLLPAANRGIRDELLKVELMWNEVRPILDAAVAGRAVTKEEIGIVVKAANAMAVPLTMALIMYLSV
jgi:hypothetical protein